MNDQSTVSPHPQAAAVELLDHYRLKDKPERTFEALQVFFPQRAAEYFAALRSGRTVRVEHAGRAALLGQLASQGFRVRLAE